MLPVEQPFKTYTGLDGKPLDNGYVYFGQPNQNPITAPVTVYWDAAGTIPAAQPLRTVNGYIMRGGTPANVFFGSAYSELVLDSKKRQVFYARTSDEFSIVAAVYNFISSLAASAGASLIGFIAAGTGAIARTLQDKNRERVSPEDYGAKADGVTDDTRAFYKALAAIAVGGAVVLTPGKQYRITDTITVNARSITCAGQAEIVADLNTATKDAIVLDATVVRIGTAQDYVPCGRLEGVTVLVRSLLRDGIRIAYGDYPALWRVHVQRDPTTAPTWRDGVHVESKGDQCFIENLDFRSVRVHDAGRSGFRFEVPAAGTNVFINVGIYDNCEVRGCGQATPGYPVHFVSLNTTATEKISSHTFTGGEYQTNNTTTNPNPDGFRADQVAGGGSIENIHVNGATVECVPTNGTGYAFNTSAMTRAVLTNFLPYGFTGAPTGVGGTGKYPIVIGYLGLEDGEMSGNWTPAPFGEGVAGAPVMEFSRGAYTMVGKLCFISFQYKVTDWGGASGRLLIGQVPVKTVNDAFAQPNGGIGIINAVTLGAGYTVPTMKARYNTSIIELNKIGSGVNTAAINIADLTTPFELAGSIVLEIA
jgi:hypothetical protein